jgi:uncharacterized protein with HEPN domain
MTEPRNIQVVINEMLDHIDYVLTKTRTRSAEDFQGDRDIRQSVERSLEIISEASRFLPVELKDLRPEIPWRNIADFGNVLRHSYFVVDPKIVWRITIEDLAPLREALLAIREGSTR